MRAAVIDLHHQRAIPVLLCIGLLAIGPLTISTDAQGYRWWQDTSVRHELGLTSQQVDMLEQIFVSTLAERRALRIELDRLDKRVQRLLARADVDDSQALDMITQLESTRAKRNAVRTFMLFQMYRALSSGQRRALTQLRHAQTRSSIDHTGSHDKTAR